MHKCSMIIQSDIVSSIHPNMPSKNPFFSGQHKRRSCLPVRVGGTPIQYDQPSPLRIVKRNTRRQSVVENTIEGKIVDHNEVAPIPFDSRQPSGASSTLSVVRNPNILSQCSLGTQRRFSDSSLESLPNSGDSSLISHNFAKKSIPEHTSTRNTSLEEHQADEPCLSSNARTEHEQICCASRSVQSVLPQVLAPQIVVSTNTDLRYDGREYIWAAIEISGKLSHTYPTETLAADGASTSDNDAIDRRLDRFFKYGCLYDLSVEVTSAPSTDVVEVFQQNTFPAAMYSGSTVLIVAKVRFREDLRSVTRQSRPMQHNSDELLEDLVLQLGDAHVPFMHIRTTYCHSAFPEYGGPDLISGLTHVESRIETTATASLKRNNVLSSWSPISSSNSDTIFDLMKRHWGVVRAAELMRQVHPDNSNVNRLQKCQSRPLLQQRKRSSTSRRQVSSQSEILTRPMGFLRFKSAAHHLPTRLKSARSLSKTIRSSLHSGNGRSLLENSGNLGEDATSKWNQSRVSSFWRDSLGHENKSTLRKSESDLKQVAATVAHSGKDVGFWGWGPWF